MKKNEPLKTFQTSARWILLIGLLTGIFFSSGEGIRLWPFPLSPNQEARGGGKGGGDLASLSDEKSNSYIFSVRGSAHSLSVKFKAQKNLKDFALCGLFANEFDSKKVLILHSEKNYCQSGGSHDSGFLLSTAGRAPPSPPISI
jgi:hypothetical protein